MSKVTSGSGVAKIPQNADLQALFKNILKETGPARKLQFQQLTEALQTGGVGARIPIIQRAVEAQMAADQQSATLGRQATARAGIAGSPFDVASQLGTRTAASSREAAIGPSIAAQMIAGAPAQIQGATQQAIGIAGMDLSREEWNSKVLGGFLENLKQSLEFTGSMAAGGGGAGSSGGSGADSAQVPSIQELYSSAGMGNPATFNQSWTSAGEPTNVKGGGPTGSHWWSSIFG